MQYGSAEERIAFLERKVAQWCAALKTLSIADEQLHQAAYALFDYVKLCALSSKHRGFREEREWRIVYLPERDTRGLLKDQISYTIGHRGVEPKLKLPIRPLAHEVNEHWTFADILDHIILGPTISSPLARKSVIKMLEALKRPEFKAKVVTSSIPLRPIT